VNRLTRDACQAFIDGDDMTRGNTHVHHNGRPAGAISRLYLHGHLIAERDGIIIRITMAGYASNVTRERLNGLLELLNINRRIHVEKHAHYFRNTLTQEACEITVYEWIKL
jgi:hypothetical protein